MPEKQQEEGQQHASAIIAADIMLVRRHFSQLKGSEASFADAFYTRLFEIAPELRSMFPADLAGQGRKLMTTLAFAIGALDRPDVLAPAVRELGTRHVGYGVTEAHFQPVATALLETLSGGVGSDFEPHGRTAWTKAVTALAGLMAEGMALATPGQDHHHHTTT